MRVKAIMIRILLQLAHDKRTIGLMILAPILVLTLMSFIFDGSNYHPKIGIINAPLNFVNNFSDLSTELLDELKEALERAHEVIPDDLRTEIEDVAALLQANLQKIA